MSMSSVPGDPDLFICENCGNKRRTSWGDCQVPSCNVCKGEKDFVQRILRENKEIKKELETKKGGFNLTIYIGCDLGNATLEYPEYQRMPKDCVNLIAYHIDKHKKEGMPNPVILTCSDIPINFIGRLIGDGEIKSSEVSVIYEGKTYVYDNKGYLKDWCYGIFSY